MPTPNPKGLYCPECKGHRLFVTCTKKPCPGVRVRYLRCSACSLKLKTREVLVRYVPRARAAAGS